MRLFLFLCTVCSHVASQQLPASTELFPYRTSLDKDGNFILRWNFNDTHIAFEIIANTLGYVGFGISKTGLMVPADVFVAYVKNSDVHYADFHTRGKTQPRLDRQQDWNLQYGYEEEGKTIIGILRKLDTCDPDFDRPIKNGKLHLIYAYHPEDPTSLRSLAIHSLNSRGSKRVRLLVPPPEPLPPVLPKDTKEIDFKNINFTIPASESSFECLIFNMSHNKVKHHVLKLEPVFDPSTKDVIRSLTLYRCYVPDASANFVTGQHYDCHSNPPEQLKFCQEYVGGFRQGSESMYFPEDVGIGIGGEGEPNIYMLAVHYKNDKKLPNLVDNSGIRVTYTKSLRSHEGSFFTMGNIINKNWYQFIPPGETDFQSTAYCSNRCLNWANNNKTNVPMTTVGVVFQTQSLGRQMKLRHLNQNNQVTTEHPWLSFAETFDSSKEKLKLFETRSPIQSTDSLMLECTYDSSKRNTSTLGGWGKDKELCRAHILYYPRKHIAGCMSWSNYDQLKDETGHIVNPSKTFSTLKTTDWTNNKIMRNNLRTALRNSLQMEQCWSSYQDPSFAYSYFQSPAIAQPYKPPTAFTCPKTTRRWQF